MLHSLQSENLFPVKYQSQLNFFVIRHISQFKGIRYLWYLKIFAKTLHQRCLTKFLMHLWIFCGIVIFRITFVGSFVFLYCRVLCLKCYCKNSGMDKFLEVVQTFFKIATFQNSRWVFQISPDIVVMPLLYLFNFF